MKIRLWILRKLFEFGLKKIVILFCLDVGVINISMLCGNKLIKLYSDLCSTIGIEDLDKKNIVGHQIKKILRCFMESHNRVAIYCYGFHTKMLMTDFISDIRDVICIVDNNYNRSGEGFVVIKEQELADYNIDGVIISSYKYKDEIKQSMSVSYPWIDCLDIYQELKKGGIALDAEYYFTGPYKTYCTINEINNFLDIDDSNKVKYLRKLLNIYVSIKEFRLALDISQQIANITDSESDRTIIGKIKDIYNVQIQGVQYSSKNNVLLLCLDGMRFFDYADGKLDKTRNILNSRGRVFTRAYSYSTMTFESLIPAFSENTDQRSEYYRNDAVEINNCRFCKKAIEQGRKVFIYGDGYEYISGDAIKHTGNPQTFSEKLWDLSVDMCSTENGLFYLHELYESHYSYPNPYTRGKMVATGTAMLFDYLPKNGGKLQVDYTEQLKDSLHYIDDTLSPFLDIIPCSMLIFADHGNLVIDKEMPYTDISNAQLSAAEEWIRIPWIILSENEEQGEDGTLVSLLDINDVVISLLENRCFFPNKSRNHIKIGRSAIYNPDFKELYRMMGSEYSGEAFEGFIFDDGYKLMIYSNGRRELYRTDNDELINDTDLLDDRYEEIRDEITIL